MKKIIALIVAVLLSLQLVQYLLQQIRLLLQQKKG